MKHRHLYISQSDSDTKKILNYNDLMNLALKFQKLFFNFIFMHEHDNVQS